ncbi:hypothetical protein D3C71_2068920 [compost metagenome]
MVCMTSSTGLTTRWTLSERDMRMPIGRPIAIDRIVQTKIIEIVRIVSSHMSK